ncbi:MAG TPA: hypothetical protein VD713_01495, partial [Sphingomonadales bacterium]|nr:hypothetical protein [Sphingomonadales bacterium]
EEATAAMENALYLMPQIDMTRLEKGLLLVRLGKIEDAVPIFERLKTWSNDEQVEKVAKLCSEEIEAKSNSNACRFDNLDAFDD